MSLGGHAAHPADDWRCNELAKARAEVRRSPEQGGCGTLRVRKGLPVWGGDVQGAGIHPGFAGQPRSRGTVVAAASYP